MNNCRLVSPQNISMEKEKPKIIGFGDLRVYQDSYKAMLLIFESVLPKIPNIEKHDFISQLSRSSKAVPRLIAEGHSKRHQNKGFQKYLNDSWLSQMKLSSPCVKGVICMVST